MLIIFNYFLSRPDPKNFSDLPSKEIRRSSPFSFSWCHQRRIPYDDDPKVDPQVRPGAPRQVRVLSFFIPFVSYRRMGPALLAPSCIQHISRLGPYPHHFSYFSLLMALPLKPLAPTNSRPSSPCDWYPFSAGWRAMGLPTCRPLPRYHYNADSRGRCTNPSATLLTSVTVARTHLSSY